MNIIEYLNSKYKCDQHLWMDENNRVIARMAENADGIPCVNYYYPRELTIRVDAPKPSRAVDVEKTYDEFPEVAKVILKKGAKKRAEQREAYILAHAASIAEQIKPYSLDMVALIIRLEINGIGGTGGAGGAGCGTTRLLPGGSGRRNATDGEAWLAAAKQALDKVEEHIAGCLTQYELDLLVLASKHPLVGPWAVAYAKKLLLERDETEMSSQELAKFEEVLTTKHVKLDEL